MAQEFGVYTPEELTAIAFLIVYIAVIWGIGFYARRYLKGMTEFYIGTRRIPVAVIALYGAAACASGWTFVGQPGATFKFGPVVCIIAISAAMSFPIAAWLFGWKMRVFSERYGLITIPDLMEACYSGKLVRIVSAVGIIIGCTTYLTAQYKALGILLGPMFHIGYHEAVVLGIIIYAVYVTIGGFMAGAWINAIQIALMILATGIILGAGFMFSGGWGNLFSTLAAWETTQKVPLFSLDMSAAVVGIGIGLYLSYAFLFIFGGAGQPHIITKMYALARPEQLKWYAAISAAAFAWVCGGLSFAGLFTRYFWAEGVIDPTWTAMLAKDADYAIIYFSIAHLPAIFVGVVFAAVLAAVFTTSDGFLMMASAGLARDIVHKCIKPDLTPKQEVLIARLFTIVVVIIAVALVWTPPAIIMVLGIWGWGTLASVVFPATVFGVNWKRVTKWGAIAGIIVGLVTAVGMGLLTLNPKVIPFALGTVKYYKTFLLHPGIWGLALSSIIIVVVSLLTKPSPQNQGVIWTEAKGIAPPPPPTSVVQAEKETLYRIAETFPTFKILRQLVAPKQHQKI